MISYVPSTKLVHDTLQFLDPTKPQTSKSNTPATLETVQSAEQQKALPAVQVDAQMLCTATRFQLWTAVSDRTGVGEKQTHECAALEEAAKANTLTEASQHKQSHHGLGGCAKDYRCKPLLLDPRRKYRRLKV